MPALPILQTAKQAYEFVFANLEALGVISRRTAIIAGVAAVIQASFLSYAYLSFAPNASPKASSVTIA